MPRTIDRTGTVRLRDEEDARLLEVLPRRAYERGHLPGAESLPLTELSPQAVRDADRDRPVVVYCSGFL